MRIVGLQEINSDMKLAQPIYDENERILLNIGTVLKENYIKRLYEMNVTEVYIDDESSQDIEITKVIDDRVKIKGRKALRKIINDIKKEKYFSIDEVEKVVDEIIEEIYLNNDYLLYFGDLRVNSDAMYGHSLNVTVISLAIGSFLSYCKYDMQKLGLGAILHDIGKASLNNDTAWKNPLKQKDKDFCSHPELGYRLFRERTDVSPLTKYAVLAHHERIDGKGYPHATAGEKIHEFARVVAVANTFDILTNCSHQSKKQPVYQAVEYLVGMGETMFDKRIVETFVKHLSLYPNGTYVRLSSGETAIVKKQNKNMPARPVVKIVLDKYGKTYKKPRIVDLIESHSLMVIG